MVISQPLLKYYLATLLKIYPIVLSFSITSSRLIYKISIVGEDVEVITKPMDLTVLKHQISVLYNQYSSLSR